MSPINMNLALVSAKALEQIEQKSKNIDITQSFFNFYHLFKEYGHDNIISRREFLRITYKRVSEIVQRLFIVSINLMPLCDCEGVFFEH